jgi:hypothetical protein
LSITPCKLAIRDESVLSTTDSPTFFLNPGSGLAAAATLLSTFSAVYATVKLAVCATAAASGWAPALVTMLMAATEAVVLLRVRRAVRSVAAANLKERCAL